MTRLDKRGTIDVTLAQQIGSQPKRRAIEYPRASAMEANPRSFKKLHRLLRCAGKKGAVLALMSSSVISLLKKTHNQITEIRHYGKD